MKIQLQIGSNSIPCVAVITDAPRDYDGFGTISIESYACAVDGGLCVTRDNPRLVLAREEHLEWQLGRYQSGMNVAFPAEEGGLCEHDVEQAIWRKLSV